MLWGVLWVIVALIFLILLGVAISGIVFLVSALIMVSKKTKYLHVCLPWQKEQCE